jgi:hypothetical protein
VTRGAGGWRWSVGFLAGVNAVAALAGAVGLVTGWLSLEDLTERLPFGSAVLGGLALASLVAVPQGIVALLALRRSPAAAGASVLVGAGLVAWIMIEVAFLRVVAALQVIYVVIGLAQVTVGFGLGRHDPGVSVRSLAAMVWAVIADLPRFLTSPLYRRWHRRWGATQEELTGAMPGDALLPHSAYSATRAISIPAAPETVWAWLVQVGADRAGWYSDDLLDHAGLPSSRTLVPEWQGVTVGTVVAMSRRRPAPEGTCFRVAGFETARWLLWRKSDSTWSWRLTPEGPGATRLVTRVHARYDWHNPMAALIGMALMELGDFAMMRRMLLGLKERAAIGTGAVPGPASG